MRKKIKVGVIGTGFIGPVHVEALRRLGNIEVAALAEVNQEVADKKAVAMGIPRAYGNYKDMLKDPEIVAVHNCTPNNLHFPVNRDILNAGKHCISEKPLALDSKQSKELVKLAAKKNLVNAVNFNYRFNPVIQHARAMIANGELGTIWNARGTYVQDWLINQTDYNWRINTEHTGASRCFGDIGSHWCDMVQMLMGCHVTDVVAESMKVYGHRLRPKREIEAFAGKALKPKDYKKYPVKTEDLVMVMMKFENGATGSTTTSQISAGYKNGFTFAIDGSKCSIFWDQQRPNELWIGYREKGNEVLLKDGTLLKPEAARFAHYPGGHNEGYDVGPKNFCMLVYEDVAKGRKNKKPLYADYYAGHVEMAIVDAVMASAKARKWTKVKY